MFTNRRPYYGLKMSTTDFFREPVRYLKESNTQESMMEKPYLEDEYPKMHLKLPDFKFKPREIPSIFGPIAGGDPFPGLAMVDFGDAKCHWEITNVGYCTEGPIVITMSADYLWHAEFDFIVGIPEDTIGVLLEQLEGTTARAWDKQDYQLTFPEDANGSVTICGFASTHTLISQTFETVVAGMPVGVHLIGGALVPIERGQSKPATLLKSVYGDKGDDCGCITLSSNCTPGCECKDIGYTTRQMNVDEVQSLTVIDSVEGCTYDWSIISGGGSLSSSTGTSVDYTAPSSNANCVDNPTIALSMNGNVCDRLRIAVNAYMYSTKAYWKVSECDCSGYPGSPGGVFCYGAYYNCEGIYNSSDSFVCYYGYEEEPECAIRCSTCATPYGNCSPDHISDARSEGTKASGCCPVELI